MTGNYCSIQNDTKMTQKDKLDKRKENYRPRPSFYRKTLGISNNIDKIYDF